VDSISDSERRKLFMKVYSDEAGSLWSYARNILGSNEEASDLVQTVFADFWKALEAFRREASIKTFFRSIADHKIADAIKRISDDRKHILANSMNNMEDLVDVLASRVPSVEELFETREAAGCVLAHLASMPNENHRTVLALKYLYNWTPSEIASHLDISDGAARQLLHRASKAWTAYLLKQEVVEIK